MIALPGIRWIPAGLVLCLFLSIASETNAQPTELLSLNRATNLAINNSPTIRQISWQIQKTDADGYQNSRLVNPQVGSVATEIGNGGQGGQYGFFLQRNIVRNNRVAEIQNAAQWKIRSLDSNSQLQQRRIAYQIAELFITIEYANRQLELLTKKKGELENIKQIVEMLSKGGELSPLVILEIEVDLSTVEQQMELIRIQKMSYYEILRSHVASESAVQLDFDFDAEVQLVLKSDFQRAVELDDHPAVAQISDQIEAQKWRFQLANSRQRPDWQIQTSVNFDTAEDDFFGGFQFNVPWQINDRKEGLIASEAAGVQILNETRNLIKLKLERRLIDLDHRRKSLAYQVKSISEAIIPKVDEASTKTTKLFHAGEADYESVKKAIMESYRWREKKLEVAKDLLLVEAETETLVVD